MNYADSERVAGVLESLGYVWTEDALAADFLLYNTCSVRQKAEDRFFGLRKVWQSMKADNPKKIIALTGCIPAHGQYKLHKKLLELDLIFKIEDLGKLPELLSNNQKNRKSKEQQDYFSIVPKVQHKFQVLVPIMTGCNNFCSYCIVPYTRGRERSRPVQDILNEVKKLVAEGALEVTLLGQNVNSYRGLDEHGQELGFPELLKLVDAIPGYQRLRFSSSHPKDFSDELIACFAKLKKLCPHMHLPVQAGSNAVLKAMNRKYTRESYLAAIQKLKKVNPEISITSDIIVGFPGETKEQFEESRKLLREVGFDMVYISPYSLRPGTAAAKLPDDVPDLEKKRRFRVLTKDLKAYLEKENQRYLGKSLEILVEGVNRKGEAYGRAPNSKTVTFPAAKSKIGDFVQVEITEALAWELRGAIQIKNEKLKIKN